MYTGENSLYLQNTPTWHVEDSLWKSKKIFSLIEGNSLKPNSIAEIGCGAGEILNLLYYQLPQTCILSGYDISQDAIKLAKIKAKERLTYYNANLLEQNCYFDLLLIIDVLEHVEDYYGFLKKCSEKSKTMILAIPLDISFRTILRPSNLKFVRDKVGHIHFFTSTSALMTLENCGFEIIDFFFTSISLEEKRQSLHRRCGFRAMYSIFGKQLTADILGYHTLYVLVKRKIDK
jgi:SAM-dependent methyltransferase